MRNNQLSIAFLLLIATTPQYISSFITPNRIKHGKRRVPSLFRRRVANSFRGTITDYQLNAYLDSLNDITSNPELFPYTSSYIRTLSQKHNVGGDVNIPSAEQFLAKLSSELLRAPQNNMINEKQQTILAATGVEIDDTVDASEGSSTNSLLQNLLEISGPALTSVSAVGLAASTYNAESYSYLSNEMMASTNNIDYSVSGDSSLADFATSTASADIIHENSDTIDATNNVGNQAVESFASWHKDQGGSNALRDLASSIPTPVGDLSSSQMDNPLMGNPSTNIGHHVTDFVSRFDTGSVANAYETSSLSSVDLGTATASSAYVAAGHSGNIGGGRLQELASSIPIDDQLQQGASLVDSSMTNEATNQVVQDVATTTANSASVLDSATSTAATALDSTATASMDGLSSSTVDQASSISDVSSGLSDTLSSQLNDLDYDGLHKATSKSPLLSDYIEQKLKELELPQYHVELPNPFSEGSSHSIEDALSSIKEASGTSKEKLEGVLSSMTHTFDGLGDKVADLTNSFESMSGQLNKVADVGTSSAKSLGKDFTNYVSQFQHESVMPKPNLNIEAPVLPKINFEAPAISNLDLHLPIMPDSISKEASAAVQGIGDSSLSDFGHAVTSTITFTGGLVVSFLNLILGAVAGTSIASLLSTVQSSISSTIENASHSILSTLSNIGNMTIIEILQSIMAMLFVITDILLKILNAIIYIISGKDGSDWALQASYSVDHASSQLMAQAYTTYTDLTHTSLTQLAHNIGDYSHSVGNGFVTIMGSLNTHGVDGSIVISDEALDSISTTLQTALNL